MSLILLTGENAEALEQFSRGQNTGTEFLAREVPLKAKKNWLKHTLKSSGSIQLDAGAVNAVVTKGASLLPSGICGLRGSFSVGDSVDIVDGASGQVIAKGICQYNHRDLAKIKGMNSSQIVETLGYCPSKVIVHRDDMVILFEGVSKGISEERGKA